MVVILLQYQPVGWLVGAKTLTSLLMVAHHQAANTAQPHSPAVLFPADTVFLWKSKLRRFFITVSRLLGFLVVNYALTEPLLVRAIELLIYFMSD